MKAIFIEQTGQPTPAWNQIEWEQVERTVRRLQERIYRATVVVRRYSRLERHARKLARAVLRGRGVSNDLLLPDAADAEISVESGRWRITDCLTIEP